MKHCPKCKRTYGDDTLRFCLDDGVPLVGDSETRLQGRDRQPPPTAVMHPPSPTVKSSAPTVPSYLSAGDVGFQTRDNRKSNTVLTAGVIAIAVLLLALVGMAAYFVLRQSGGNEATTIGTRDQRTPTPSDRKKDPAPSDTVRSGDEITTPEPRAGTPLRITATASSQRLAVQANTYYPSNAIDGKRSTAWIEGADGPGIGEWIQFDFDREIKVHRILIQPGYFKSPQIWAENNRLATVTAKFSDGTSRDLTFVDVMTSQKIDLGVVKTKWVRLVIKSVYYGTDPDTALSEVAFEWEP